MKVSPPLRLMRYISYKDGKVVAIKPIPKRLQKLFDDYCETYENAKQAQKQMFDNISKDFENNEG